VKESELLKHVYGYNRQLPESVSIGPGDDMGGVLIDGRLVLVAVDQVIDGIHVDMGVTTVDQAGCKAVLRNLSDVAAMAARPVGAVVAVVLPGDFGTDRATGMFDVMRDVLEAYCCPLIGGDISIGTGPLVISVTVFAEPAGIEPVLRSGARPGDAIYVTGELGGSTELVSGRVHHIDFSPRIKLARFLASESKTRPHCMIDVSDGLAKDLGNLARASGVHMCVDAQRLPVSAAARSLSSRTGRPIWQHAVGDGEDYELLFTATCGVMPPQVEGVPITEIGTVLRQSDKPEASIRLPDGCEENLNRYGWEHGR